ncbi:hypothetical protein D3C76_1828950 [compost metagenome]
MVGFTELREHLQASGLEQIKRLGGVPLYLPQQTWHGKQFIHGTTSARKHALTIIGQTHTIDVALKQRDSKAFL